MIEYATSVSDIKCTVCGTAMGRVKVILEPTPIYQTHSLVRTNCFLTLTSHSIVKLEKVDTSKTIQSYCQMQFSYVRLACFSYLISTS